MIRSASLIWTECTARSGRGHSWLGAQSGKTSTANRSPSIRSAVSATSPCASSERVERRQRPGRRLVVDRDRSRSPSTTLSSIASPRARQLDDRRPSRRSTAQTSSVAVGPPRLGTEAGASARRRRRAAPASRRAPPRRRRASRRRARRRRPSRRSAPGRAPRRAHPRSRPRGTPEMPGIPSPGLRRVPGLRQESARV